MPVPLAPYPPPPPYTPPPNGAQSQVVCSGCRNLLLYPVGATSVCCAVCNAVTTVPPPGTLPRPTEVDSTKGRPTKGDSKKGQSTRGEEDQHVSNYTTSTDRAWAPSLHSGTVCGGCHTLLMFIRGATNVQCSCCHTVNLALEANQVAHVNCGNCEMLLRYQYGARSVKCAICSFVTSIGTSTITTTEQKFST